MRIGIFGGSFDPAHNEHIRFAKAAIEQLGLDRLFVMPAHTPPHKKGKALTDDNARLDMCKLAFLDVQKAFVSDYEIQNGGTSYTYLTCRHFRKSYPNAQIFWLLGTDMLWDFYSWKNPDDILRNVELAVCGRNQAAGWEENAQTAFLQRFGKKFVRVDFNGADVSSTAIRILAAAGEATQKYLPASVSGYIQEKELYKIAGAKAALTLESPRRKAHSLRVAELAASRAVSLGISEKQAVQAALFHDCAKNLERTDKRLRDFQPDRAWGDIPNSVWHQFAGAYLAEKLYGVEDEAVLNAIRYHTSARPNMTELEKLIFLSDMLEKDRAYEGVEALRALFWQGKDLTPCLTEALRQSLLFLKEKNAEIYPLTQAAYAYYAEKSKQDEKEKKI